MSRVVVRCALRWADEKNVVGLFYDRDYVLKLNHGAFPPDNMPLSTLMEKSVVCAQMSTPLSQYVVDAAGGLVQLLALPQEFACRRRSRVLLRFSDVLSSWFVLLRSDFSSSWFVLLYIVVVTL